MFQKYNRISLNHKWAILLFLFICTLTACARSSGKYEQVDISYQIKDISMLDMKKGWALSSENEILFTDSGVENFASVRKFDEISEAGNYFVDVCFVDEWNVYAAYISENGELTVEHTKDGGKSWQQTFVKWKDETGEGFFDLGGSAYISFVDAENGYLLYCSTPAMGLMTKKLFYTTDAAESFSYMRDLSEISGYPQGLTVSSGKCYIAVSPRGEEHYLYALNDIKEIWKSEEIIPLPKGSRYMESFSSPVFDREEEQNGMVVLKAVGDDVSYLLLVTEDGGENWVQNGKIPLDSVKSYSCVGTDHFYLIDDAGNLYEGF